MSIEEEIKMEYVNAINVIWKGAMQNNRLGYRGCSR